jgi:deoxyribodipyrimidine photolyase-related protein
MAANPRTARAVRGLDRLQDVEDVLRGDRRFDGGPP